MTRQVIVSSCQELDEQCYQLLLMKVSDEVERQKVNNILFGMFHLFKVIRFSPSLGAGTLNAALNGADREIE